MAERITRLDIADKAIVHTDLPVRLSTKVDRSFELPTGLYVAMATLFFGFVAVMAIGFAAPGMIVPIAIIVVFIAMFFAVPAVIVRTHPQSRQRAMSWARFQREGIVTHFGPASARDATIQVLILPVLIFLFGVAVAAIAALV